MNSFDIQPETLITGAANASENKLEKRTTPHAIFPITILPVKKSTPDTAYGTQYTANISYTPAQNQREVRSQR